MSPLPIFLPCVALVALTIIVWVRLYVDRIGEMRARRIKPQAISTSREAAQALQNLKAADNFRNLFEVPVLFYVLCVSLAVTQSVTILYLLGAWIYVVLRTAHSFIHLTYNRVMHRFVAYALSTILVLAMWAGFGVQLLSMS